MKRLWFFRAPARRVSIFETTCEEAHISARHDMGGPVSDAKAKFDRVIFHVNRRGLLRFLRDFGHWPSIGAEGGRGESARSEQYDIGLIPPGVANSNRLWDIG